MRSRRNKTNWKGDGIGENEYLEESEGRRGFRWGRTRVLMGCAVEREAETGESTRVEAAVADKAKEEAAIAFGLPCCLLLQIGTTPWNEFPFT